MLTGKRMRAGSFFSSCLLVVLPSCGGDSSEPVGPPTSISVETGRYKVTGSDRAALPIDWGSVDTQDFELFGAHLWIESGNWFRLQIVLRAEDRESNFFSERFLEARGTFVLEGSSIRFEPDSGDPEMQDPFTGTANRADAMTLDLERADGISHALSFEKVRVSGVVIAPDTLRAHALTQLITFTTSAVDQDGDGVAGAAPDLSVTDPQVLEITTSRAARAVGEGESLIIAEIEEFADTAVAIVRQVASEVLVQPTRYGLLTGDSLRFEAWILDSLQNRMEAAVREWSIPDPGLAQVREDGTVVASTVNTGITVLRLESEDLAHEVPVGIVSEMDFGAIRSSGETCGLARGRHLFCWRGQVRILGPDRIGGVTPTRLGPHTYDVLDTGGDHGCAITPEREAHCWGKNSFGQVGDGFEGGNFGDREEPVVVIGGHSFVDIATGRTHTCGVTDLGTAYCWGSNGSGELGSGEIGEPTHSGVPIRVTGEERFGRISAGEFHTCALAEGGRAFCWGNNSGFKLGTDSVPPSSSSPVPLPVEGGLEFASLVSGGAHNCGITVEGDVYCWGIGWDDELPGGQVRSRVEPSLAVPDLGIVALAEGGNPLCGVTAAGDAYCWEAGDDGESWRAPGDHDFVGMSAGSHRTCGITRDGTAYCWGNSPFGLGDGSTIGSEEPVRVSAPF